MKLLITGMLLRIRDGISPTKKKVPVDNYEFHPGFLEITERPPAPWARKTATGIALTFLLALLWSVLGKLDIQASASGQLVIPSHSKVIQPVETAEVTAIHVQDGQHVQKGEMLVSLNPVNADIRTGKRRVIDYLLSPLEQYQSEAMKER